MAFNNSPPLAQYRPSVPVVTPPHYLEGQQHTIPGHVAPASGVPYTYGVLQNDELVPVVPPQFLPPVEIALDGSYVFPDQIITGPSCVPSHAVAPPTQGLLPLPIPGNQYSCSYVTPFVQPCYQNCNTASPGLPRVSSTPLLQPRELMSSSICNPSPLKAGNPTVNSRGPTSYPVGR